MRVRRFIFLIWLLTCAAYGSTHYISISTPGASDSNNGTSTATPWLHARGMPGCTANCASYTPQPGDRFIFMGGDTWPITSSWNWSWSGSSGNPIYIGIDLTWKNASCTNSGRVSTNGTAVTWLGGDGVAKTGSTPFVIGWTGNITINGVVYTIASVQNVSQLTLTTSAGVQTNVAYSNSLWCRPILDFQQTGSRIVATYIQYTTLEGFELINHHSFSNNGSAAETPIQWEPADAGRPAYNLFKQLYIHKWTHDAFTSNGSKCSRWNAFYLGSQHADGEGQELSNIVVDGAESTDTTYALGSCSGPSAFPEGVCTNGSLVTFDAWNVHDSVMRYLDNGGIINNGHIFSNNLVEKIYGPSDNCAGHTNGWEQNDSYPLPQIVSNNLFRNVVAGIGTQWAFGAGPTYYYNNVVGPGFLQQCWDILFSGSSQENWINNTFIDCDGLGNTTTAWSGTMTGNLFINSSIASTYTGTNTNNVNWSNAQAITAGYTDAGHYAIVPTSTNCNGVSPCPRNGAVNQTSLCSGSAGADLCSDTRAGNTRIPSLRPTGSSAAWDIGAYQFQSAPPNPPNPPTNVTAAVDAPPILTLDMIDWMTMDQDLAVGNYMAGSSTPIYTVMDSANNRFWWVKNASGSPWDVKNYDANYIYDKYTEQIFADPYTWKDHVPGGLGYPWAHRFVTYNPNTPGVKVDEILTPTSNFDVYNGAHGPTTCAGLSSSSNLGNVKTELWGPFTESLGGTLPANMTTFHLNWLWSCDSSYNNCATKEVFTLSQRYGQVRWQNYSLVSGSYVLQQDVLKNTLTAGTTTPVHPCFN